MIFLECRTHISKKITFVNVDKIISLGVATDDDNQVFVKIELSDENYKVIKVKGYMNEFNKEYINFEDTIEYQETLGEVIIAAIIKLINSNLEENSIPYTITLLDIYNIAYERLKVIYPELKEK